MTLLLSCWMVPGLRPRQCSMEIQNYIISNKCVPHCSLSLISLSSFSLREYMTDIDCGVDDFHIGEAECGLQERVRDSHATNQTLPLDAGVCGTCLGLVGGRPYHYWRKWKEKSPCHSPTIKFVVLVVCSNINVKVVNNVPVLIVLFTVGTCAPLKGLVQVSTRTWSGHTPQQGWPQPHLYRSKVW